MTDNIVKFYPKDAAENPDAVLEQAIGQYEDILILGYNNDGELEPRGTLGMTASEILWLLESFKMNLLDGVYSDD